MNAFAVLLQTDNETEFFIALFHLLKARRHGLRFEIESAKYNGEMAFKIPVRQMVFMNTEAGREFEDQLTHIFYLTQSSTLVWEIPGIADPVIGLANIQRRLHPYLFDEVPHDD